MGRKPNPKPDDPAQSKRFTDMAREVEADGTKENFARTFNKIASAKRPLNKKSPSDLP